VRPGLLTTVQDCGRWGFQDRGVPVCGAMDLYSHRAANRLVGNSDVAATLEVTLMGPEIRFEGAATFAVAGGAFALTLDDASVPMNARIHARPGSRLKFGDRMSGARAYVAFAGGVEVPEVFNSRSTHLLTSMGGFEGRPLRAGDRIEIGAMPLVEYASAPRPLSSPVGGARLRVISGPSIERVSGLCFRISTRSDRMGYRLEGPRADSDARGELVSRPIPTGTVQVTPSGEPILLMADHATAGGYPIAAVVIAADLPIAGQLAPGDWVEFAPCTLDEADEAAGEQERALAGNG
jgi:antagonist of KipI